MNFISIKKGTSASLNIVLLKRKKNRNPEEFPSRSVGGKFIVDSSPLGKFFQKNLERSKFVNLSNDYEI